MKYFLSYRFNERDGILSNGSRDVAITRKAGGVLRCLIEHAGTSVPHEKILSSVWPNAHVQPDNIKVLVSELRRALEDDPRAPRCIRSDPGRGYAFIAPLSDGPLVRIGDSATLAPPIHVGRHDHLPSLADALADSARTECRIAVIEAERGMGKTALCDAFLQYASALPSVRVCYGQCLQHAGVAEPYFPVLDALHHLTRQSPATIAPVIARHAPTWFAHLRPWIADPAPAAGVSAVEPLRMIRELSALLEALGADAPTVMVLDDLHWGDVETVELLQALARRHAPLRTLIIATTTPCPSTIAAAALRQLVADLRPARRCLPLTLAPLTETDVRAYLLERFMADPVAGLAPSLHALTGGNPLALVSTVDALVLSEYVTPGPDGWQLRYPVHAFDVSLPESVREVAFWRFTQLGAEDRVILECAASIGPRFSAADVTLAAGVEGVSRVTRRLEGLCARGFIQRFAAAARDLDRGPLYGFLHPVHADLLASRAPVFDRLYAVERLGIAGPVSLDRCS